MTATRRTVLAASVAALAAAGGRVVRAGASPSRVVILDWGLAETFVSLGAVPLGVAETVGYSRRVIEPALPSGVIDVGLRVTPNLELLQQLRPDLILIPPWMRAAENVLRRIAETKMLALAPSPKPYENAVEITKRLGQLLAAEDGAQKLLNRTEAMLGVSSERLREISRPVYIVSLVDPFHAAVYGPGSMFHDVMGRVGLHNAWRGAVNDMGMAIVSADRLAAEPEAVLVYVEPLAPGMTPSFWTGPVWRSLPFAASSRMVALPPVWFFGGLPSAGRFARLLTAALTGAADGRG